MYVRLLYIDYLLKYTALFEHNCWYGAWEKSDVTVGRMKSGRYSERSPVLLLSHMPLWDVVLYIYIFNCLWINL